MGSFAKASINKRHSNNLPLIGWLSYDFAASAYTFAIVTLFVPLYYTGYILPFENTTMAWGLMVLSSYAIIVITGPLLGAYADRFSNQTQLFRGAIILTSLLIFALIFADEVNPIGAIALFIILNVCFGITSFLYDCHLVTISSQRRNITVFSGIAWALGYVGGPLSVLLIFIVLGGSFPDKSETYELAFKIISGFYLVFSLPVFLLISKLNSTAIRPAGITKKILGNWREHKSFFLFLLALFFMSEGAITVIYFASIYSRETLGFTIYDTALWLGFGQIIGVFSTIGLAVLATRIEELKVLILCSAIWILALTLITVTTSKTMYYAVAFLVGLVIGGIPSISRGYVAKIIKIENRAEAYSLVSTVTRFAAIFGPAVYVLISNFYGQQKAMLAPVPFFIIGTIVLIFILQSNYKTFSS